VGSRAEFVGRFSQSIDLAASFTAAGTLEQQDGRSEKPRTLESGTQF
jgi:hypothetical protein